MPSEPLPGPPDDPAALADFPRAPKERIPEVLFRIHRTDKKAEFFDARPEGNRFNPPPSSPPAFGTCYLSTQILGSYIETLGRMGSVSQSVLDAREVSEAVVPTRIQLADMTHPSLLGRFGLNSGIGADSDYRQPCQWAERLHQANFDGVWYRARHDVTAGDSHWAAEYQIPEMFSIALFGEPGVRPDQLQVRSEAYPVPEDVIEAGRRIFHLMVLPAAPL